MRTARQSHLLTTLDLRCLRKARDTFPTAYVVVQYIYSNMLQIWAWACNCSGYFSPTVVGNLFTVSKFFSTYPSVWVTYWLHWIRAASAKRGILFQRHMWSCNTYTKICYKFEPEACNCSGSFSPTVVGILFTISEFFSRYPSESPTDYTGSALPPQNAGYFSSHTGSSGKLIKILGVAKSTIYFFTSWKIIISLYEKMTAPKEGSPLKITLY